MQSTAQKTLQTAGYKLTKPRLLIIESLAKTKTPLNAYEIAKILNKKAKSIDIASVYRTLKILKETDLAHETSQGKFIACQKPSCQNQKHSHYQFICKTCQQTTEIHIDDSSFLSKIQKLFPEISIQSHNFQFSGLCPNCKK